MDIFSIKRRLLLNFFISQHSLIIRSTGIHTTRKYKGQTHYEVLGVNESCTHEDIKKAFITKSKLFHPDKIGQSPKNHKLFVSINESYSVLSKRPSRTTYDRQLKIKRHTATSPSWDHFETNAPRENVIFRDESFWEHRDRSKYDKYEERPYYGIKGIERMSNSYILVGIFIFMTVGLFFNLMMARVTFIVRENQMRKRDYELSRNYMAVRERAKTNGNEKQVQLIFADVADQKKEEEERTAGHAEP